MHLLRAEAYIWRVVLRLLWLVWRISETISAKSVLGTLEHHLLRKQAIASTCNIGARVLNKERPQT